MYIMTTILIASSYVGYTYGVLWGIVLLIVNVLIYKNELKDSENE